ncbi:hypothetical protein LBMAG42_25430 [Deltaproteobacteria bacterium]|nr:hypothetical protein LBMAG42_25430 [Deltaproteobacteria bacterium]
MLLFLLLSACGGRTLTTDDAEGHRHNFTIPREDLRDPPDTGVALETTEGDGHTHTVTLSAVSLDLLSDLNGIGVSGTTEETGGHAHEWHSE